VEEVVPDAMEEAVVEAVEEAVEETVEEAVKEAVEEAMEATLIKIKSILLLKNTRLRGCVRPLRIVPRKNICFVLLVRSCFHYSVFTIFVQFLTPSKNLTDPSTFSFPLSMWRCHCYAKVNGTFIIKLTQPYPLI
jgi:hypothetical protein